MTRKHGVLPQVGYPPLPPTLLKVTRISSETTSVGGSVKPRPLGRFKTRARMRSQSGSGSTARQGSPRKERVSSDVAPKENNDARSPGDGDIGLRGQRWAGLEEVGCGWGHECRGSEGRAASGKDLGREGLNCASITGRGGAARMWAGLKQRGGRSGPLVALGIRRVCLVIRGCHSCTPLSLLKGSLLENG